MASLMIMDMRQDMSPGPSIAEVVAVLLAAGFALEEARRMPMAAPVVRGVAAPMPGIAEAGREVVNI